jgi:ATP-dependent protease Clp ATPase subunit
LKYYCCAECLNFLRCTYRFSACEAEGEEIDVVELEKSNVLLMGPTGSGAFDAFS